MLKGMDWSSIYTFCPWLWRLAHMTIWELSGNLCLNPLTSGISIHTLLAESDFYLCHLTTILLNFNPHSPRREWRSQELYYHLKHRFQSTLSSQRVTICADTFPKIQSFQSTLSSQRVTRDPAYAQRLQPISIHTLLAESDCLRVVPQTAIHHFNPHSPRREWLPLHHLFTILFP